MIRRATLEDVKSIQELYGHLIPDDPVVPSDQFDKAFTQIIQAEGNVILVGEDQGHVVSTCYLNLIPNLTRSMRPYALIENVVTHPDHRRKGHGTAVLQAAMQVARDHGCYKVMLLTGSKRPSTLKFYESAGLKANEKTGFHTRL
ncbi:MAG: GNAT family N-acetyltransferase [Gemmatimonadetes bacterium]|jgi:GNAT superfamily N-acetyltransferase|nr:GNAT family N-acetyltransferase [Gemmatimonadota bacterium]MBT4613273.1 GNAT family N-acetyltransferase [Gemmatimonadota bacterium]MBT5058964.1 GNAT family N-acetyltransferase [Gemmatimonadota bacterium]MBT5142910.1 GNAT family N-acetyltransferase [Gemmatimonadota bacterium]MBT5589504.1 GNAT family N-acetyltransferase [Gemmatimonadota bacterium]